MEAIVSGFTLFCYDIKVLSITLAVIHSAKACSIAGQARRPIREQ